MNMLNCNSLLDIQVGISWRQLGMWVWSSGGSLSQKHTFESNQHADLKIMRMNAITKEMGLGKRSKFKDWAVDNLNVW